MLFKKDKKIMELNIRIEELEELLCPFNHHEWIEVGYHLESFDKGYSTDVIHHYKCKRCKKTMERI